MLHTSLSETLNKHRPLLTTLTARLKTNPDIINLRMRKNKLYRMKKDCSNPDNKKMIYEEIFKVNDTLKKRIRQERDKFRKEQITEIEDLQQTDCRRMWQELKRLAGWTGKTKEIQAVLNDKQEEVCEEALKVFSKLSETDRSR